MTRLTPPTFSLTSRLALFTITATTLFAFTAISEVTASPFEGSGTAASTSRAQDAAELLPPSTVAFAKVERLDQLVDLILNHPMREKVESLDVVQAGLESDEFTQFQAGLQLAEFRIGMKWHEALSTVSAGGIHVALDAETEGVVLLAGTNDEAALAKLIKDATDFVQGLDRDAQPFETHEYRGYTAYKADQAVAAQVGPWLLISNQPDLAKSIVDRYEDGGSNLTDNERFQEGTSQLSDNSAGWAWVDVAVIRDSGMASELFTNRSENIAVEFLFGGIQEALKDTDYAAFEFDMDESGLGLALSTPFRSDWIEPPREFFFGMDAGGVAPAPLEPQDMIFTASTYRDIGSLWLSKEDLFEENHIAELSQADSNLSTLFAGVDFGEEVLGAAEPGFQIVVTRQNYDHLETPVPAIKVPAFALVFELKEPKEVQRTFKVAYQSIIGFVNIGLGQEGQPQLEFNTEDLNGSRIVAATYFADPDEDEGRINYNFSPSIAFVDDNFVLSSTVELARELTELIQSDTYGEATKANSALMLDGDALAEILGDNREQLIAQNMLEDGNDYEEAGNTIDTLLSLVQMFEQFSADLAVEGDQLKLHARLSVDQ